MCGFDKKSVSNLVHTHTPVSYTHLDVYKRQLEYSRPIVFVEDRVREKYRLPATFYVLTRVFSMANDNSRKFKQNQIIFAYSP